MWEVRDSRDADCVLTSANPFLDSFRVADNAGATSLKKLSMR
jgi:hypothetical protein